MNNLKETPWQYDFPPFFTLQINEKTRLKQVDAWCDLIISYCKQNRIFILDLIEAQTSDLFYNKKIDRKLAVDFIQLVIDELVRTGKAEWINVDTGHSNETKSKKKHQSSKLCIILWHTIDEWSKLIYDYVCRQALQNTVCTYFELTESEDCCKEEFFKLNIEILRKALRNLEKQNKAEVFQLDDMTEGVKFF
jgi:ESCRT-II complex subunit VPS25